MRKKNNIKCGEYWYKDGVVIKRPGKKFRLPSLPRKMRSPKENNYNGWASFFGDDELEKEFQQKIRNLHNQLRRLYILSQLNNFILHTIKKLVRKPSFSIRSIVLFANTRDRS